jgi:Zn-dependent protease with chaperone function
VSACLRSALAAAGISVLLVTAVHAAKAKEKDDRTLVVRDTKCEKIVKPFKLKDNIGQIFESGVKDLLGDLTGSGDDGDSGKAEEKMRQTARESNWLSMSAELKFGEKAHLAEQDLVLDRETEKRRALYEVAESMLHELTDNLGEKHPYTFQVFILKTETQNALARPGGYLYLDQGLLADEKLRDKARFALAHELAHVLQRHETRELQGLIVDSYESQKDFRKDLQKVGKDPSAMLKRVKFSKDSYVRHQIDQELQADACSVQLLSRAYPEDNRMQMAIDAFLSGLPAAEAGQAPAAKSGSAPAPPSSRSAAEAKEVATLAADITRTPESRHPNSMERTRNLRDMSVEVKAKRKQK